MPPTHETAPQKRGAASDSFVDGQDDLTNDNNAEGMALAETLARLSYDHKVEIRSKTGSAIYSDTAGVLLEDHFSFGYFNLDEFELLTEVHFTLPDPNQIPLPDHLRPYQAGDIGGAVPDPASEVLLGPIGEWLQTVEPETEASMASLGGGILAAFGALLGRQVTLQVGRVEHPPNLLVVQVGRTGIARKGTADAEILGFVKLTDPEFARFNTASGFGSGEALIERVSDPKYNKDNEIVSGTEDQRLLIMEGEFSKVLRTAERKGSILGDVIRLVYDGRPLANRTKGHQLVSSNHCVALFGGITPEELVELFTVLAATSGTGNRYLWVWSNPDKLLPRGGADITAESAGIANRIRRAPKRGTKLTFTDNAVEWWDDHYETLRMSTDVPMSIESLTTRSSDHVQRIALIYAAIEGARQVDVAHLEAGMAWRNHSVATVGAVLGGLVRNREAGKILAALRTHPGVAAGRSELHEVFRGHTTATAIDEGVRTLQAVGLVHSWTDQPAGAGRPADLVIATTPKTELIRSHPTKTAQKGPSELIRIDESNPQKRQVDTDENEKRTNIFEGMAEGIIEGGANKLITDASLGDPVEKTPQRSEVTQEELPGAFDK